MMVLFTELNELDELSSDRYSTRLAATTHSIYIDSSEGRGQKSEAQTLTQTRGSSES
jgi:hypothetical protein